MEKVVVAGEGDGWTDVKGRTERRRRSVESSVLSEESFPSLDKGRKEKLKKEQLWRELLEQKKRERKARDQEKREKKVEKQLEEAKKELESQREQRKQEKLQLKREKEESGSERRIAAGFKKVSRQSSEESEVEQLMSDNLLEPEKEKEKKRPQRKMRKVVESSFSSDDDDEDQIINSSCQRTARKSEDNSDWSSSDEDSLVGLIEGNTQEFENMGYSSDEGRAQSSCSSLVEDEPVQEEDLKKARALEEEFEKKMSLARETRKELEKKYRLQKKVGKKSRPAERRVQRVMPSNGAPKSTPCPVCAKGFENYSNVRRHMIKVHKMSAAEIKSFKISCVSTLCPHCEKPQTTLSRHLNKNLCKAKRVQDSLRVDPVQERSEQDTYGPAMESLVNKLGSKILLKKVKFYLETQTSYAKDTKRVYFNRMGNMLAWMEANIKNFRGNRLLFPLECNVYLPSAGRYLDTVTQMSKPTAIKTYLCLCSFIQDRCDMLYSSDPSVNKNDLNAFNVNLANSKKLTSDKQSARQSGSACRV